MGCFKGSGDYHFNEIATLPPRELKDYIIHMNSLILSRLDYNFAKQVALFAHTLF